MATKTEYELTELRQAQVSSDEVLEQMQVNGQLTPHTHYYTPDEESTVFDSELSDTSENAVQNKVLTEALINKFPNAKVLWENPNPKNSFASQTITLASDDYNFLLIICGFDTSNSNSVYSAFIEKGRTCRVISHNAMPGSGKLGQRQFEYVDATHYKVASGYWNLTVTDSELVPRIIYGF